MKTLVLVLALMVVCGGAVMAEAVTFDIYQGWNLMALPQAPFEPAAPDVLKSGGTTIPLYYNLSMFEPISGSDFPYDPETESFFGGLLLGQGYWLYTDQEQVTIEYNGFPSGLPDTEGGPKTDMWISLPGSDFDGDGTCEAGNWHMVGTPYNHFVDVGVDGANVKFTDGTVVKTWAEASTGSEPWVSPLMFGFSMNSDVVTGYTSDNLTFLIPSFGYWLETYRPSLAMIIDGNAEYVFE